MGTSVSPCEEGGGGGEDDDEEDDEEAELGQIVLEGCAELLPAIAAVVGLCRLTPSNPS